MKHLMKYFLEDIGCSSLEPILDELTFCDYIYEIDYCNECIKDLNGIVVANFNPKFDYDGNDFSECRYLFTEEFKELALKIIIDLVRIRIESWLD